MRLSELLERGILNSSIGILLNKFEVKSRRSVLFFEDILADYVKSCEDAGYEKKVDEIARKWGLMGTKTFTPRFLKKIPKSLHMAMARRVWKHINILSDGRIIQEGDNFINFKTKNEFITRIIGKNGFVTGFFTGCLEALYGKKLTLTKFFCRPKDWSIYYLRIEGDLTEKITKKPKSKYNDLNKLQELDVPNLRNAIKENIFQLDKNVIYFRGKTILILENTIFHLISNNKILLNKVADISYDFFNQVIDKSSTGKEKLNLLKTLLQIMGWGVVKILIKNKEIIINIRNLPHGLQVEKDNWEFLIRTILGFLWLINKNFKVASVETKYKALKINYSV